MNYKTELKREKRNGYVLVTGIVDGAEFGTDDYEMTHAETPEGHYIGDANTAAHLCDELRLTPELARPTDPVCSIGFCADKPKWFGWSHRAINGFWIGSEVKRGDCAYVPTDMEDARLEAIDFWSSLEHEDVEATITEDEDGKTCFDIVWKCSEDPELIPNAKMRGKISGVRSYPPEQFGNGEWTAKTPKDAKQMARDFAEGVG